MFKFLRKYNKFILAVGGVLLMITFLIPQAITSLSQQAGERGGDFATVGDGETVTSGQLARLQREVAVLQKLENLGYGVPGLGRIETPQHWYLLTREAEQAGLVATMKPQGDNAMLVQMTGERDVNLTMQTMAKRDGVAQMIRLFGSGGMYSDQRLRRAAARLLHMVSIQPVVIEADADKVDIVPTDEQIAQQLAQYQDVLPAKYRDSQQQEDAEKQKREHDFGYKLPDRVKLEWVKIPAESVRQVVESSPEFDGVAQYLHWKRDPDKKFPAPDPNVANPPVPEIVRTDLLEKLTKEKIEDIAKFAADELLLHLNRAKLAQAEGYYVLPEDWQARKMDLQQLAATLQSRFGIALPEYHSTGERWAPVREVGELEDIGDASSDKFGRRPMDLAELVANAREFKEASLVPIQKDIAGPVLKDTDGTAYVFRIIGAEASRAPTSIDEVRAEVVKDLKRLAHYEQLAANIPAIEQQALNEGLVALALAHDTVIQPASTAYLCNPYMVQFQLQQQQPIQVRPAYLPVIEEHRATVEAIIDHALTLPTDKPVNETPLAQRTLVTPVKDKLCIFVSQATAQNPVSREIFVQMAEQGALQALLMQDEIEDDDTVQQAFSFEALAQRHNFALAREQAEPEADEGENPPAGSAAKAG